MDVNISLTEELGEFVKAKVSSGRYNSASEVVSEALRLLEQAEQARVDALRRAWAEGEASGDAGVADFAGIKQLGRQSLKTGN
ncbi:putative transcriptional regulators, CopG/Arc/MetJ DNA-binding domain [Bradyrhizobium sp. ORS 285]|uniref:type II toxin-antitoxin system ParD family antitoxin n=1 Tax=Bradyrhizobium sp. ORS 285 TaxID=115808 RepID=UPI000240ABA0|nr:type II toxin-antitoxin system ParD family antitoxin [Bradyrhizobium sp. ORS 285]CCD86466.1 putative transcriptional regulators, CopG/Arc/MetJ DNA-binding domain [Bradyrhizobium sp. ORS 285]SMX62333.1 putative transcriptional regulators, CopG/Arc/MetJ DNA-binding domain [Bradyrhizobium sp. ORS 285]